MVADAREQRGRVIADTCVITQKGRMWEVPSQSGNGKYMVNLQRGYCSCPDHAELGVVCKHIHAVKFTLSRTDRQADGTETVSTLTVEAKVERKTYRQDWPTYNRAQVNEHRHFQALLFDLCRDLPAPAPKPGRQPLRPADGAFTAISKVYSTLSARRFMGELDEAADRGYITKVPHFNSVLNFFDTDAATAILSDFIPRTAAPLAAVESDFAVDSTGFAGARYLRWTDEKYGTPRQEVAWVKVHAMIGVRTNVVTSAAILDKHTHDCPQLPALVQATAEQFTIQEVSADKAYCSRDNFAAVEAVGGTFYPAFKKNTTGKVGGSFEKAFHLFSLNRDEYLSHYHKRSNIEATFSMMKRKFGESLRSKTDRAMRNETRAKIVAHNICCLIGAMYELGVNPALCGVPGCTQSPEAAHILKFPGV